MMALKCKYHFELAVIKRVMEFKHGLLDMEKYDDADLVNIASNVKCNCKEGDNFVRGYAVATCPICYKAEKMFLKRLFALFGDQQGKDKKREIHPCLKLVAEFSPVVQFEKKHVQYLTIYKSLQTLTPLVIMRLKKMPKYRLGIILTKLASNTMEFDIMKGTPLYKTFSANEMRSSIVKTITRNYGKLVKYIGDIPCSSTGIAWDISGERFPTETHIRMNEFIYLRPESVRNVFHEILQMDDEMTTQARMMKKRKF